MYSHIVISFKTTVIYGVVFVRQCHRLCRVLCCFFQEVLTYRFIEIYDIKAYETVLLLVFHASEPYITDFVFLLVNFLLLL